MTTLLNAVKANLALTIFLVVMFLVTIAIQITGLS